MNLKSKTVLLAAFLGGLCLVASQTNAAPPTAKTAPATVESVSQTFDVQPSMYGQTLATYAHPQIRHVSVSIWVNFSSADGQTVAIYAKAPSGATAQIATFYNGAGPQQFANVQFDAAEWDVRAFNNSAVNAQPVRVDYIVTTIY